VTHWPPWKARNAAEQQEMIDAVVAELLIEDEHAETLIMRWDGTMATEAAFRAALYTAKASARRGKLERLRRLLSDLDPSLPSSSMHRPACAGNGVPDCRAGSGGGPMRRIPGKRAMPSACARSGGGNTVVAGSGMPATGPARQRSWPPTTRSSPACHLICLRSRLGSTPTTPNNYLPSLAMKAV